MPMMTYFYQECPVCGRSLRVPVQYFGSIMSCSHCSGEFQAVGGEQSMSAISEEGLLSERGTEFLPSLDTLGLSAMDIPRR